MAASILVLSASVGAGHMRAAEAVGAALKEISPESTVETLDVLTLTNAAFRQVYAKSYLELVNKAPHLLGLMYDLMDRKPNPRNPADRLRVMVEQLNLPRISKKIATENWDVVVNTHFLSAEIIASLRNRGKSTQKQMTVTTDFETHRLWVNPPTDRYTTATAEGAGYLAYYGVPADTIDCTGIPIHPAFSKPVDREKVRHEFGLAGDRPVVLQLAGGFGVGPIEKLFRGLLEIQRGIQLIVVAGKNAQVKKQLEAVPIPDLHGALVMGYTDRMHDLMAVADLVVSKPGGLTTSEVLARGAAMAIVNPIPGQESRNSDYLLEAGAAIRINNLPTMAVKIGGLLDNAARLEELKTNARRIARPRASFDVAKIALDLAAG